MSKKPLDELLILKEISIKLDHLIKINALSVIKDKTMTDQIGILAELGFKNPEIAKIVGTTSDSVKAMKSQYKKKLKNNGN